MRFGTAYESVILAHICNDVKNYEDYTVTEDLECFYKSKNIGRIKFEHDLINVRVNITYIPNVTLQYIETTIVIDKLKIKGN